MVLKFGMEISGDISNNSKLMVLDMKGMRVPNIIGRGLLLFCLFVLIGIKSQAQTDTEFWFVVPDVTQGHGTSGGKPANLTFSAFDMPSTVTISMPANPAFADIVVTIPARTATSISMNSFIDNAGNPNIENHYNTLVPNKCGLKITSTTPITAYYQIANFYNTEIYALKGKNALGQQFFVPFQNRRDNGNYSPKPYSSINIVATEDNTVITVKPTQKAYMHGRSINAGGTGQITINKGECIAIVPDLVGGVPSQKGGAHLAGTEITSDKNIAITTNDDSVNGLDGCADTIGDQLVNISSLGKTYVVYRTRLNPGAEEDVFITAVKNGTSLTVKNNNGNVSNNYTLNAGDVQRIVLSGDFCILEATEPISVFHLGGFGCELGGAILPAIDKCTGSTQVAFTKLSESGKTFNTNIMVRTNGKNEFYLNGTKVNFEAITGKTWTQLPGTDWWFIQVLDWTRAKFPSVVDNGGNILINKGDLFHLGVFYGGGSNGCNYGYFSDFNELKISGQVAGIDVGETKVCFGTPVQMYATGGTTYKWTPAEYLSDPTIYNPTANIPVVGVKKYQVEVSGACNMKATVDINLQILPPVEAGFSVDNITGCSPLTVKFKNTSLNAAELRWKFGDGTDTISNKFSPPGLVDEFSHVYVNNSDTARTFTIQLIVKSEAGCGDMIEKKITVYPSVNAVMNRIDPTPQYCSPRTVGFENVSPPTSLLPADITYIWDFGDGTSLNTKDKNVSHSFSTNDPKKVYDVTLTMLNKFGCKSIDSDTISVYGAVDAFFAVDKTSGCPNPKFEVNVTDGSRGAIVKKNWNLNGFSGDPLAGNPFKLEYNHSGASSIVKTLTLEAVGHGGCKDVHNQDITIYPYVNAAFTIGTSDLCDGNAANIINTSSAGSTEFLWEFGDGSTSTDANPTHIYANPTYNSVQYDIKLTAKSAEGCTSTYTSPTKITVFSKIDADFAVKDLGGCAPFNATIVNNSKGNANNSYEWNYGDGSPVLTETSFIKERQHQFVNTTTDVKDYFVDLLVTNEGGCQESVSRVARVYPQPVADFTVDKNSGCNPLPVTFTASTNVATYDYRWSFDDGGTASTSTVTHTYNNFDPNADKVYNANLQVSSIFGCAANITKPITVHPFLKGAFTIEQLSSCTPFDVRITPSSVGATKYTWDYGDGRTEVKTTGAPFVISYDNPDPSATKNYTIKLVAQNAAGACQSTAVPATITVLPKVVAQGAFTVIDKCNGVVTFTNTSTGANSYSWDFGDGQSSNEATPTITHTYINRTSAVKKFTATLTAINERGCTSIKTFEIQIVPRVESSFTLEEIGKCTPKEVKLTNTSLNGTEFRWDYGYTLGGVAQGVVKSTKDPFNVILDNEDPNLKKTYTVTLTSIDLASGCSAVATTPVTVYPKVVAAFTNTVTNACSGDVSLQNTSTGANTYTWTFGDGSSAFTTNSLDPVSHTYVNRSPSNASYTVTLKATNEIGCIATLSQDISIVPRIESSFVLEDVDKCTPKKIRLTNTSLNGTEFHWDYGYSLAGIPQEEIRNDKNPFVKTIDNEDPNQIKTYTIKLTTVDAKTTCTAVSSKTITVYPRVVANFSTATKNLCTGEIEFANLSTGGKTYTWVYGDESSAYTTTTLDPVSHIYLNRSSSNATFNAKLTVTNEIGCTASVTKDVSIVPRIESHFTLEEIDKCTPKRIRLTNTALNGTEFTWNYGHQIGGVDQIDVKSDKLPFEKVIDSESLNTIQTYPISLTVVDKATLCQDISAINLTVYPKVLPSFTSDKMSGCSDLKVNLTNTSTGGNMQYSWNFGDGQSLKTSLVTDPVIHTYVNRTPSTIGYKVVLNATNEIGCAATATKTINVHPKVEAGFSFTQPSSCTPFPIDITNSSLNGTEFSWDFGHAVNGNNRDTVTVDKNGFRTYIYNSDPAVTKDYTLTLTARDAVTGCSSVVTKTIKAQPEVHSAFNLSIDRGCNPLTVSFTNNSTGSSLYSWNFGNNTSSNLITPPAQVYRNSDTASVKQYTVTLLAKNKDGCTNVSTKKIDVFPTVLADFNLDKVEGCTPLKVNVTNPYLSSAYRYEWELGSNGTSTSGQIPTLNFINSTSDYSIQAETLKLKVFYKGDAACFKEVVKTVKVYPPTRSDFSMDKVEGCNPLNVTFANASKSFNNSASYKWSFGTIGTSAVVNPSYKFLNLSHTDNVLYKVQLKSTSIHGCTDSTSKTVVVRPVPKAEIAINTASGCAPFNVDIQNLSVGVSPTYTFWLEEDPANVIVRNGTANVNFTVDNLGSTPKTSTVWHKVVSDFGCKDSISQKIFTYPHVKSQIGFSPTDNGCNPLAVNFTSESTNATYFTWDFDDGITAHLANPNHIFHNLTASDKTFNVRLTAKSEFGCENTSSKVFTVFPAPMAYFTIDPQIRTYPDASFLITNKTTPMAPGWNYEWEFGDGNKFIGMTPPVHTYKTWAPEADDYKYFVKLKVNNGNCSDEMTQFLYLKPAIPISIFESSLGNSCAPLRTQFTHQAKYYKSIEWDFGDGTKSSEDSPYHEYHQPGRYHVQLTVKGEGGTSYSYKSLSVYPNPIANFKWAPSEAMLPEGEVHFYNTSTEGKTFFWNFGDGVGSSTEQSPVYNYKNLGLYDVQLTVTSENGCVDDTLVKQSIKVIGEGLIKFPNAFIPNVYGGNGGFYDTPDYKNEVFHPVFSGIVNYKLFIYDRWGQLLFESSDVNVGWDGYYKGKLCEQGVYVYRAQGRFTNGKTYDVRGDVTLLR